MKLEEGRNININGPKGQKAKVSMLAILSFTLGIMSIGLMFIFFFLFYYTEISEIIPVLLIAISAIVLGCFALVGIKRSEGKLRGKPMAWMGIIMVILLFLICLCLTLLNKTSGPHLPSLIVKSQFSTISTALELFNSEFDYYPPSGAMDDEGRYYCGALKLSEAMMGRDLQGFHPNSKFKADGLDNSGASLYNPNTLEVRKGPYLPEAYGNPCLLKDLYENIGPCDGNEYVLCDTYRVAKKISNGMYIGMPVLYYKADTSKTAHDINDPNNPENIYDYRDNHALLALGVPGKPGQKHPLYEDPKIFYEMTRNVRVAGPSVPNRADTYILLSAGPDGLYGTKDDIPNFDFRLKPK